MKNAKIFAFALAVALSASASADVANKNTERNDEFSFLGIPVGKYACGDKCPNGYEKQVSRFGYFTNEEVDFLGHKGFARYTVYDHNRKTNDCIVSITFECACDTLEKAEEVKKDILGVIRNEYLSKYGIDLLKSRVGNTMKESDGFIPLGDSFKNSIILESGMLSVSWCDRKTNTRTNKRMPACRVIFGFNTKANM